MKKFLLILFSFIGFASLHAQQFGNEWIIYNQQYYKIKVAKNGVYRIDSVALANAGINLSSLNPLNIQLFFRGKEQAVFINGEQDGVFNGSDYLEFYGVANNGYLDSLLYDTASVSNPYYSLFNDTSVYFLTWNSALLNKRFQVVNDTTFSLYTPVNYFFKEEVISRPQSYYEGYTLSNGSTLNQYVSSEGWFENAFIKGASPPLYTFNTSNIFSSGPSAKLNYTFVGASNDVLDSLDHQVTVEFSDASSGYIKIMDTLFDGYVDVKGESYLSSNSLGVNTNVRFTSVNNPTILGNNRTAVAYVKLKYPHTTDFESKSEFLFYLPDNTSQSKSYVAITNFNAAASSVFLYDITNSKRYSVTATPSLRVLVQNANNEKTCYLFDASAVNAVSVVTPVSSTALFTDYSLLTYDSSYIIISPSVFLPEAANYAMYRSSASGGSHNVIVAEVNELYDQFAYGIVKHPLSIRNFTKYAISKSTTPPAYLFLFGKSISINLARKSAVNFANSLVPSIGSPCSDNMFTSGLADTTFIPAIPTGRLSAYTKQNISDYLNKVIDYENNPPELWMKQLIHFGGGKTVNEQQLIKFLLQGYESIIRGPMWGATVSSFFKNSSQPIQLTQVDSVKKLINRGVSMMNFFGHAYGSSFDQNIDYPQNYNNVGKYPFILGSSCFSGDIHQPPGQTYSSISEDWVLIPNKGAIGFMASVTNSVVYTLNIFNTNFYTSIANATYAKGVGDCIKSAIAMSQINFQDQVVVSGLLSLTLNGDPAVKFNCFEFPDYAIADTTIYFTPSNVTTLLDTFKLNVIISNLGKANIDTIDVEVKRIFPDGSFALHTATKIGILYKDTVVIKIPIDKTKGAGLNKFEIRVDPLNNIFELSDLNNDVVIPPVTLFIKSGDIAPVYPYEFAIIPDDSVTVKASTGDPFEKNAKYAFQVDTTDSFINPLASAQISSAGGVVEWDVPLTLLDSTVYYWRVRRDTMDTINYKWKESSFQYIKNKRGWEQAHFYQFKNDNYNYIDYNKPGRSFDFVPTGKTLFCEIYGQRLPQYNLSELYATQYKLDLTVMDYAGCGLTPAIHVAVIDPVKLTVWGNRWTDNSVVPPVTYNPNHFFGNANDKPSGGPCGRNRVENYFIFRTNNAAQLQGMRTMLLDSVPNGYYILAYTWLQGQFNNWADPSVLNVFDSLGATTLKTLTDTVPYIFFCKKGDKSSVKEIAGANAKAYLTLTENLKNNSNYGSVSTGLIGPSSSWDSLSWWQLTKEPGYPDSLSLSIIGVEQNGKETVVKNNIPLDSTNFYIKNINAVQFPYLKLNLYMQDDSFYTASQLKKWQVFYQPVPEVALNPKKYFSFYADSTQEGDSIKFSVTVQNISEFYMDSMLVNFWVVDQNRIIRPLSSYMSPPLKPDSSFISSIAFSNMGYPGKNTLWMEVNPVNTIKTRLEQFHFNNIAELGFFVGSDRINPLLDVTFDGIHILNGDIVSPKPAIVISVKDENKFLALNDTSDFAVYLKYPGNSTPQRIYFSSILSFTPATLPANSCKIDFTPYLSTDGTYELIVQAYDKSGNISGANDYRISFEVVNKSSISNILNYPNPFTTSTRFVFTLTGCKIPDQFKIQIFTITGKLVKEIYKDELGPLHIGRNITQYAWDGKDMFGDRLANGIYLYRVDVRIEGEDVDKLNTNADKFFTKGFGKMYLMR